MTDADIARVNAIFDAIDLLFKARDVIMARVENSVWYLLFGSWKRDTLRLERAQAYLADQLGLGGWNCFKR